MDSFIEIIMRSALDRIDAAIFGVDVARPEWPLVFANRAFCRMVKAEERAILGESVGFMRGFRTDRRVLEHMAATVSEGRAGEFELVAYRADGSAFNCAMRVFPVPDLGEQNAYLSICEDMTSAKARHEREAAASRLADLGHLSAIMAHEMSNLLQPALLLAELVRDRAASHEDREDLEEVTLGIQQAREVLRGTLAMARPVSAMRRLILGEEVERVTARLRKQLPPGVLLQVRNLDMPGYADFEETRLNQILVNLVRNANEAMEGRGAIEIALRRVSPAELPSPEVLRLVDPAVPHFRLTVADDGPGMDAMTLGRAFEPFFTTKPPGVGTGLGLAAVAGIARSWGGNVTAESAPGQGTWISVWIPVAQ